MNRLLLCGLLLTPLLACNGKTSEDDDDGDAPGLIDDSGGGGGGGTLDCDDEEIPCVEGVDAFCYENLTGASAFFWKVDVEADDPQGADTLDEGTVVVTKDDNIVHDALVVCSDGDCFASWNIESADSPMDCSSDTAGNYTFTVTIEDEDGNISAPASSIGYRGTDQ